MTGSPDGGLRYAKVDVRLLRHPKLLDLSPGCLLLYLASVLWSVEHLSDGHIPATALDPLGQAARVPTRWRRRYATQLVECGLWHSVPVEQGGWQVHDFDDWQLSKHEVAERRAADAERQRRSRARRHAVTHDVTGDDVTRQEQSRAEQSHSSRPVLPLTSLRLSSVDEQIRRNGVQ